MATSSLTASASQSKIGILKSVVGETTLVTEYHVGYALRKENVVFTLVNPEKNMHIRMKSHLTKFNSKTKDIREVLHYLSIYKTPMEDNHRENISMTASMLISKSIQQVYNKADRRRYFYDKYRNRTPQLKNQVASTKDS